MKHLEVEHHENRTVKLSMNDGVLVMTLMLKCKDFWGP